MGGEGLIALLIVDVQNDFLPPDGKLAVDGGRDILPHVYSLLDSSLNWPWTKVVASQDYHPQGHISFVTSHSGCEDKVFQSIKVSTPQRQEIDQILWPEHCIQGTYGCELEAGLQQALIPWQDRDLFHLVQKGTDIEVDAYSAFAWPSEPSVTQSIEKGTSQASACQDSPLASYLISHGAKKLVIVGIATDVCVKATAEDALACGFDIILVEEAMKGVDAENSARTVQEFGKREGVRLCKTIQELHEAIV